MRRMARAVVSARTLIETTDIPVGDIAFAAGFSSIRQFNATMLEVFDSAPTRLREQAGRLATGAPPGIIRLRLPYRPPIDLSRILGYLAARAIPGLEEVTDRTYKRSILLQNGPAIIALRPPPGRTPAGRQTPYVECDLELTDLRDVTTAVQRCRRLLDLDADPAAVTAHLAADPLLAPLALACPGRRSPGCVDAHEMAIRAVLGQQVSVAAARKLGERLAAAYGKPLPAPSGSVTHCFPDAATLAAASPDDLPMPKSRAHALITLATALASGDLPLHPGVDREEATARLLALPGIGPWTANYIRMRALSDPDAWLATDAGIVRALARLGGTVTDAPGWLPWRSYAIHHLWATLENEE